MAVLLPDIMVLETLATKMNSEFVASKNEFQKCKTNVERVNYFLRRREISQTLKDCFHKMDRLLHKSDEISHEWTQKGNSYLNDGKYLLAVETYTQCLRCAESDVTASFAYSQRSAVLFAMGLYGDCLIDIERALKHGYPKDLHINLFRRKEKAEELQTVPETVLKTYEIQESEKNPSIQSARNCVEIRTRAKYGKYIVATRDIEIGEVLIVEKPYMSILINDTNFYCHECLESCYNLIPCPHCCFALYCGEKCKERAFKNYHRYECSIQSYIKVLYETYNNNLLFALRMTLLAKTDKNSDGNHSVYRSDRYYEISRLDSRGDKYSIKHLFVLTYMTSAVFYILKKKTNMFSEFEDYEDIFKEQFLLNLQINRLYGAEINRSYEKYDSDSGVYGSGIYSLGGLFKHSCYPNAMAYTSGSTLIVRAFSKIKKGEECLVSYNNGCLSTEKSIRQVSLHFLHHFTCKCRACEENWPVKMSCEIDGKFAKVAKKLVQTNRNALVAHLDKLTMDLRTIEETMTEPFNEVLVMRERLRIGYHILDDRS